MSIQPLANGLNPAPAPPAETVASVREALSAATEERRRLRRENDGFRRRLIDLREELRLSDAVLARAFGELRAANARADRAEARLDRIEDDAERQALDLGPRPEEGGTS